MASDDLRCVLTYRVDRETHRVALHKREVVLGRHPSCDVCISSAGVSRKHARITRQGGAWILGDLGSTNGVELNRVRVKSERLRHGDRIDLGTVRIDVAIHGDSDHRTAPILFEDSAHALVDAEVIDMGELDAALIGSAGPSARDVASPDATGDSAWSLRLFGDAAATLLASDSVDQMLEKILALVFRHLPAERGAICLWDESSGTMQPEVARTRAGAAERPIRISRHIADAAVRDKQAVLVRDAATDERFQQVDSILNMNIGSAMCAPLYRDDRVGGFVYVDNLGGETPFSPLHLQLLSSLAILSAVAVEQGRLRDRIRREQEIRTRLSRYSSPAVVDRILKAQGTRDGEMVAEECEVTVLFADLTGFTAMAEALRPAEVVRILNRVFERLTDAVFEFEGTLDKFRGDGMMAFFGAPLPQADHAERAVRAALRMQRCLAELNQTGLAQQPIEMRIGINSGPVVVGDVGTPRRKDSTVVGDTVNIASRLESAVAQPGQIVIGPATHQAVREKFRCAPLPEVQLKGKRRSVAPHLVLEAAE